MNKTEFSQFRQRLHKTQKEMSQLLGVSLRAVHGYEQGWRTVPPHVERQMLFLVSRSRRAGRRKACWLIKRCPAEQRSRCPAWEFRSGDMCWFINGTVCEGEAVETWSKKLKTCRKCEVFGLLFNGG